jgi:hypothetical protein
MELVNNGKKGTKEALNWIPKDSSKLLIIDQQQKE